MSYDLDANGNKVFYEPELEDEARQNLNENIKPYRIYFSGEIYINAYSSEDALKMFDDQDINDVYEAINTKEAE